jgi:hypothetical protein
MNIPQLWAILMAMRRHGYNTVHIPQWRMSRALLEATGRSHRANTCSVSPRRLHGSYSKERQLKNNQLCLPLRWPWQCASSIPCASPNGGGPGLH